jgi:hypothetical protein
MYRMVSFCHTRILGHPDRDDNGSGLDRVEQKPARDRTREV